MKLAIVIPCYNEEEILETSISKLLTLLKELIQNDQVSKESKMFFVDDGSSDSTWSTLENYISNPNISIIKLSRNFGHQSALLAGLDSCKNEYDCYISIDADLQDDIQVIKEFISEFKKGRDVVYGVRNDRTTDTLFKRITAQTFYKLMKYLGVDIIYNHADYRLISNKILTELLEISESNIFLRAMFPMLTKNSSVVHYKRHIREAGISKYPLKKMIPFAVNGITSFSSYPLRLIFLVGLLFGILSVLTAAWVLWAWYSDRVIQGWTSIIAVIMLIGSIQIISLGVIAEYIGKIYLESKRRPKFIIEQKKN